MNQYVITRRGKSDALEQVSWMPIEIGSVEMKQVFAEYQVGEIEANYFFFEDRV